MDMTSCSQADSLPAVSAHVVIDDGRFADNHAPRLLDRLQGCLVGHFDGGTLHLPIGTRRPNLHEAAAH